MASSQISLSSRNSLRIGAAALLAFVAMIAGAVTANRDYRREQKLLDREWEARMAAIAGETKGDE